MQKNYYELLGISPQASREDIINAAKQENQKLKTALAVLANVEKRTAYDKKLQQQAQEKAQVENQSENQSEVQSEPQTIAKDTAHQHPSMLTKIRFLAVCEGISFLLLLGVAMPLKYFADFSMAVFVVGSIHGILFVLYLVYLIAGKFTVPLPIGTTLLGILASVIPFAPFVIDRKLKNYA
ncbi:DUF3817 domain-containing protein [Candidatus Venteria ishoeyi]|uniref:DUF3817 domain-containing protein n=1 Tax=Candidatus Venteria ishoeyi TaxID=1899563 RepID=UPI0025A4F25E|nr:DUF3817 domain-containing protein [Candidatus Venteria ishoeyi]MDM8547207.1 DUF3817 domain-containing protein [Candidatus Venteria ishoeyi]